MAVTLARAKRFRRSRGLLKLLRPFNDVVLAVCVAVGAFVGAGPRGFAASWDAVVVAAAGAFAFAGASTALNDYLDRENDRAAHPKRPLPSGDITPRAAMTAAVALAGLSVALVALTGPLPLIVLLVAIPLVIVYELRWKASGLIGNLVVGALAGAPFVLGGLAAHALTWPVVLVACLAGVTMAGREILKDIEDMDADFDRRTLPQRIGGVAAAGVAASVLGVAILFSPLPWLMSALGWPYLSIILIADVGLVLAMVWGARRPRWAQLAVKVSMLLAMAAFVAGRLVG
ncbi:MAG: geranylgeranylglycerol-phosphate geranylgeranyltransferase [Candidatus Thermoplasmatota archaeon]